jgi:CubicO group peptidase (beta-lactamase class C family)
VSKLTLTICLSLLSGLHARTVIGQKANDLNRSRTQVEDDRFRAVRSLICEQMTKYELPSVSVSITEHGHIVWEKGFGYADKENLLLATSNTMYRVASITKPFTATGLMQLVERGAIDLDHPVNDYLGSEGLVARVGDIRAATVRRIANHTSGLPQHWQFFFSNDQYPVPSTEETVSHYGTIMSPPGSRYEYSNLDYAVLGEVIERASGQSYRDYMTTNVFVPLGLTHTSLAPTGELLHFLAAPYGQVANGCLIFARITKERQACIPVPTT